MKRLIALTAVIVGMVALLAAAGAVDGGQTGAGLIGVLIVAGMAGIIGGFMALEMEER